ncbi:hypothetical protein ACOMHN_004033 [Nucella lapillus]
MESSNLASMTDPSNNHTSSNMVDAMGAGGHPNPPNYEDYYYNYSYYYEIDDSINSIPLGELLPVTLTYLITLLLGLVGNSLVIFSISYYRRMRTVTNVFLLSLASADLLLVLICVPIK